jgi:sulfonate transport system ATP-binding protein
MAIAGKSGSTAAGRLAARSMQWILPVGIVAPWEVLSALGMIPPHVLPAPSAVIAAGWRLTLSGELPWNSRPRLLAFDEPLGALDALTRMSMQQLIERVWMEQGFTAILVTHDVAEAVTLADRIFLIENGRIRLDQRVDLARPRNRGQPEVAAMEGRILRELFRNAAVGEDQ